MPIKIKCGHLSSALACDLYAFLVTVQYESIDSRLRPLVRFRALYRFH